MAADGKAVPERRSCPSIHRGRHFGHIPVNVVGCHRQLVWEDGQMFTGWGGGGGGGSSINWSRQSGCKCCWQTRLQNIISDPRRCVRIPIFEQLVILHGHREVNVFSLRKTALLAKWIRRPPRERRILGLNPTCHGILPGRVWADPSLRYTRMLLRRSATNKQTIHCQNASDLEQPQHAFAICPTDFTFMNVRNIP